MKLQVKEEAEEALAELYRSDAQRKRLVGKMRYNDMRKKNYFYMFSIEHFERTQ